MSTTGVRTIYCMRPCLLEWHNPSLNLFFPLYEWKKHSLFFSILRLHRKIIKMNWMRQIFNVMWLTRIYLGVIHYMSTHAFFDNVEIYLLPNLYCPFFRIIFLTRSKDGIVSRVNVATFCLYPVWILLLFLSLLSFKTF